MDASGCSGLLNSRRRCTASGSIGMLRHAPAPNWLLLSTSFNFQPPGSLTDAQFCPTAEASKLLEDSQHAAFTKTKNRQLPGAMCRAVTSDSWNPPEHPMHATKNSPTIFRNDQLSYRTSMEVSTLSCKSLTGALSWQVSHTSWFTQAYQHQVDSFRP